MHVSRVVLPITILDTDSAGVRPDRFIGVCSGLGREGNRFMQRQLWTLLLTGAIGILSTGCASMTPTMRAQSPGCTDGACGEGCNAGACGGNCPGCDCEGGWGHDGKVLSGAKARRAARKQARGMAAHQGNGAECLNLPFHPVHRNFHTYDCPTDLSYPDANLPPASVQWPYYTLRGPTDFFMQ